MPTEERWAAIERIFHAALAHPPDARSAFVGSSCGIDVGLRGEVDSLLLAAAAEDSGASVAAGVAADWVAEHRDSLIGRDVDGYRVLSLLGAGGMGEVFLAEDCSLGRRVALKLLPVGLAADPVRLRRFIDETRAAAALNHPNVITVHHVGEFEGRRYVVTELIEGETLRDRIGRGPVPTGEAVDIALQAAHALGAAHAAGIVHRDVKPENIMIRRDGYVKVLDFGLAKISPGHSDAGARRADVPPSESATHAGRIPGTLNYMAPEQKAGGFVDPRSDLYSLAVVLHEMVTGARPAAADAPAPAQSVRVPRPVTRLLRRALAADPCTRYQDAAGLARALEAVRRSALVMPLLRRRWGYAARPEPRRSATISRGVGAGHSVLAALLMRMPWIQRRA